MKELEKGERKEKREGVRRVGERGRRGDVVIERRGEEGAHRKLERSKRR